MNRPVASRRAVRRRYAILGVLYDRGPLSASQICNVLGHSILIDVDLAWMMNHGLVAAGWEQTDEDRPRRRLYSPIKETR